MGIYRYHVIDNQGNLVSMDRYQGKVLLIVNTATNCGFTPQYGPLQSLYERYRDQGFEILDFPCNQFGAQAPGTNEQIDAFCTKNYGTTFKRFAKVEVNGPNEEPLFTLLKMHDGAYGQDIAWNFSKFLVGRDGRVVARFAPGTEPAKIEPAVVRALAIRKDPAFAPAW